MSSEVTVGLDPFEGAGVVRVRVRDVDSGRVVFGDFDEKSAEEAVAQITRGLPLVFVDNVTGETVGVDVREDPNVAMWLRQAAAHLRAHKAGEIDMRQFTGKVPQG